jgi:DNA-nicking Smr family endonuclease
LKISQKKIGYKISNPEKNLVCQKEEKKEEGKKGEEEKEEPIQIPIEDFLDLHTFLPKEVPSLLQDYLEACRERKIYSVRIIHGKGTGLLRKKVHRALSSCALVQSFSLAPPESGFWGATIVVLKRPRLE